MKTLPIKLLAAALLVLPALPAVGQTSGEIIVAQQTQFPPAPTPRTGGGGTPGLVQQPVSPPTISPQQAPQDQSVTVTLTNAIGQTLQYFYIDQDGQSQFIATMAPGEQVAQASRPGIELVFAIDGNEVASYFTTSAVQQSFQVDQTAIGQGPATQPGLVPQQPTLARPTPAIPQPPTVQQPIAQQPAVPQQPLTLQPTPGQPPNPGPSFSCTGNLNTTERVLCTDRELAQYDREMVDTYSWLRGNLNQFEQAELRNDQRDWLRQRNGCGSSRDCLLAEYLDRIAYLNEYLEPGGDNGNAGGAPVSFPHAAKSWGGQVRSGPGTQFQRLAGLGEGEPIMILEQANAPFYQDRPWFKIRFRGRIGYHWGGIICPVHSAVPGTFQVCN